MFKLPFFSKPLAIPNRFLTISINCESVRCLLIYKDTQGDQNTNIVPSVAPQAPYKVIAFTEHMLEPGTIRSGNIIRTDLLSQALATVVQEVNQEQEDFVDSAILGVSGELSLGVITTAKSIRAHRENAITPKELHDISKRITDAASIEAYNQYIEITGNTETDLVDTSSNIVYTKIDGRYVSDEQIHTYNLAGDTIEQALSSSFTPKKHIDTLKKCAKKANINLLTVGSELYAILECLKKLNINVLDCLLLDIEEDYTEICVVFGGGIVSTRVLNIGYSQFAEELSLKMGITLEEGQRVLAAYCKNTLTQAEVDTIKTCLAEITNIWLSGVEILFSEFTGVRTFPPSIYVFGKGMQIKDTLEVLHTTQWTRSIPFKGNPVIYRIMLNQIEPYIHDATGKIQSVEWFKPEALVSLFEEL